MVMILFWVSPLLSLSLLSILPTSVAFVIPNSSSAAVATVTATSTAASSLPVSTVSLSAASSSDIDASNMSESPSKPKKVHVDALPLTGIFDDSADDIRRFINDNMDLIYPSPDLWVNGLCPKQVWEFVADTDAMNRGIGSADAKIFNEPVSKGITKRMIEWNLPGGLTLKYEEKPFQWDTFQNWYFITRLPHEGPFEKVVYFLKIHSSNNDGNGKDNEDSRLEIVSAVKARNGDVQAADNAMQELQLFMDDMIGDLLRMLSDKQPWKIATNQVVDACKLEVAARGLYDLGEDKSVVDSLVHYLMQTQDANLIDMQPLSLASKWNVDDDATVSCFLRAARIGILTPQWALTCPNCRGAKNRGMRAFDIPKTGHCADCNLNFESDPRKSMQMVFGTQVRGSIHSGRACVGSPTRTPHILAQALIGPLQNRRLISSQYMMMINTPLKKQNGNSDHNGNDNEAWSKLILKCPTFQLEHHLSEEQVQSGGTFTFDKEGAMEFVPKEDGIMNILNKSDKTIQVLIDDRNPKKYARPLSADQVMKHPGFKTLFGAEEWDFLNAMTGRFLLEFGQEQKLSKTEGLAKFDLAVIGSGPGGEALALSSARFGKKVALIEQAKTFGGPTGLGSKAFRETALKVVSWAKLRDARPTPEMMQKTFNSRFTAYRDYAVSMVSHELMSRLGDAGIALIRGHGKVETGGVVVTKEDGHAMKVQAPLIALAVGSRPAHPPGVPFDGTRVLDGEEISKISKLPESILIIGGGIIAIEYASIFGALGVQCHVVNSHSSFLPMLEKTLCDSLIQAVEHTGVIFHTSQKITEWQGGKEEPVTVVLSNGKEITVETVLYAQGREGTTDNLVHEDTKLSWSKRGFLDVKEDFCAGQKGVYAIGDVVGGGVASTAMDHGRRLAHSLFDPSEDLEAKHEASPLVLWTIPEVASVGMTKEAAAEDGRDVVTARAEFRELPRGLLTGDLEGRLDMLVDAKTGVVLGCHLMGAGAAELVHYGAMLVSSKVTVEQLSHKVFAAVTLHDLYNVASERARLLIADGSSAMLENTLVANSVPQKSLSSP